MISFARIPIFQVTAILILPLILDIDGIWLAVVFAELAAAGVSTIFIRINRKRYHYV